MDVCSGDGYFTLPTARLVGTAPVFAVDIDANLLAALHARTKSQEIENVHPICGDARHMAAFLQRSVDIALHMNTFHGVADQEAFASAVRRVLTPDGRFIIVNWYPAPKAETPIAGEPRGPPAELRLSPRSTAALVEPAGFGQRSHIELPPYHYGLIFDRD
nr:class I SAM-dependent methyltransferase [Halogeometricum pallidum]